MKYIRLIIAVSMAVILVFQGFVYFWVGPGGSGIYGVCFSNGGARHLVIIKPADVNVCGPFAIPQPLKGIPVPDRNKSSAYYL